MLDNGDEIRFVKVNGVAAQRDSAFRISTRKLTDDEIAEMFGDLPIAVYALFGEINGRVLGIEGSCGDMKLLVSASASTSAIRSLTARIQCQRCTMFPFMWGILSTGRRLSLRGFSAWRKYRVH